ncbi:uncharacterized protein [Miscanthus floridulus]|uniref:uncharacterized protein n=1 Tax=Miscanthus floridulus TaxID=154761 RepID=UPI003459B7C4
MPAFLWWSEFTITFDQADHPDSIPHLGRYPLMVDPIIDPKRLTKVLMDGGSGLNIMYAKTLDEMGVDQTRHCPTRAPFHGIVPKKQAMPLEQIDLPVTFGDQFNYRTEIPTFEMIGPHGVITIDTSFQQAYECEVECCGHAAAIIASGELVALMEEVTKEAPDAKKLTRSFESAKGSKYILIDLGSTEGKTVRIGTTLSSE